MSPHSDTEGGRAWLILPAILSQWRQETVTPITSMWVTELPLSQYLTQHQHWDWYWYWDRPWDPVPPVPQTQEVWSGDEGARGKTGSSPDASELHSLAPETVTSLLDSLIPQWKKTGANNKQSLVQGRPFSSINKHYNSQLLETLQTYKKTKLWYNILPQSHSPGCAGWRVHRSVCLLQKTLQCSFEEGGKEGDTLCSSFIPSLRKFLSCIFMPRQQADHFKVCFSGFSASDGDTQVCSWYEWEGWGGREEGGFNDLRAKVGAQATWDPAAASHAGINTPRHAGSLQLADMEIQAAVLQISTLTWSIRWDAAWLRVLFLCSTLSSVSVSYSLVEASCFYIIHWLTGKLHLYFYWSDVLNATQVIMMTEYDYWTVLLRPVAAAGHGLCAYSAACRQPQDMQDNKAH